MSTYYIDTSAALKLLVEESHSRSFATFYDSHHDAVWASSTLLRIEIVRTVKRALPELLSGARDLLDAFGYLPIDDAIVEAAMEEPVVMLRSLDAIHLASARQIGDDLDGFVTYDERLAAAADTSGFAVVSPRDATR